MINKEIRKNRRVKIAFVDVRYNSFYGAQQSMHTLMTNLDKNRYKPILVTTEEGDLSHVFRQSNIDVYIIKASSLLNVFGNKIGQYSLLKKIRVGIELIKYNIQFKKWLKKHHIDVVYANDARVIAYIGLGTKLGRIPMIWYVRGDHRLNGLFQMGLFLSKRIITIAEGVKKAFTPQELRRYEGKFKTLYTGFDLDNLISLNQESRDVQKQAVGIPLNSSVIGLVGSITPRKGYHALVEAAKDIINQDSQVHFLLLGGVPEGYEKYYQGLIKKVDGLNLTNHFHWIGFVHDIYRYYSMMDVLVLPSQSEGLPRTVIEGMAFGLPVIATDVGGVREIITDNTFGSVIEVGNSTQLAAEVSKFLLNDTEENKIKRKSYVRQKFSKQSYVSGFDDIVQELI